MKVLVLTGSAGAQNVYHVTARSLDCGEVLAAFRAALYANTNQNASLANPHRCSATPVANGVTVQVYNNAALTTYTVSGVGDGVASGVWSWTAEDASLVFVAAVGLWAVAWTFKQLIRLLFWMDSRGEKE